EDNGSSGWLFTTLLLKWTQHSNQSNLIAYPTFEVVKPQFLVIFDSEGTCYDGEVGKCFYQLMVSR
ncbi:hypothetical protein M8C21_012747, partial [Ambrosia artemisiifolia]